MRAIQPYSCMSGHISMFSMAEMTTWEAPCCSVLFRKAAANRNNEELRLFQHLHNSVGTVVVAMV